MPCENVTITINETLENVSLTINENVENIVILVSDFSVSKLLSSDAGNAAVFGTDGKIFVPEPEESVSVHNELEGLNEGDYMHLTAVEKSFFDSITAAFTTTLKTAYDGAVSWIATNGANVVSAYNWVQANGSALINHLSNTSNPHNVTAAQVGAPSGSGSSNGTNTGDETTSSILTKIGDGSLINSAYLPAYVDDVLEFANLAAFPVTGETGKVYIAISPASKQYRWSGSAYIQITNGLIGSTADVPEGSNLYFTTARVLATALSGLSLATAQVIAPTDTILQMAGYLQAQITLNGTALLLKASKTTLGSELNDWNRSRGIRYFNDFVNVAQDDNMLFFIATGGSVVATNYFSVNGGKTSKNVGFGRLTTGVTNNGSAKIMIGGAGVGSGFMGLLGNGVCVFETLLYVDALSTATDRYCVVTGIGTYQGGMTKSDSIIFTYDEGGVYNGVTASPNWQAVTVSNSVRTITNTGVAATLLLTKFKIEVNATATQVKFYINDVLVATHTTNITTVLGFSLEILKSAGTFSRSIYADYVSYDYTFTTPR